MSTTYPDPDIYLDYQASTPCDERVIEAMSKCMRTNYGNPHARSHKFGWSTNDALEHARGQIAKAVNANDASEVIFTSGATESNNLAIKGLAEFWKNTKKHIITIKTEHKCLLEAIKSLQKTGWEVDFLDVDEQGLVNPQDIERSIRSDTLCVAISAVNHEIGTVQPIDVIGKITQKHKIFLHVDAAQALGKIKIDLQDWRANTISLSAHKTYGPQGIGTLIVSKKPQRIRLKALNDGGGQERGMRSGTTPVFLAVGFGLACELFANDQFLTKEFARITDLHAYFLQSLQKAHTRIYLNGPSITSNICSTSSFASIDNTCDISSATANTNSTCDISSSAPITHMGLSSVVHDIQSDPNLIVPTVSSVRRIPHNINISIEGVEGESFMMEMPNLAFSSGSACTSANLEPSYVLKAIGITGEKESLLHSSVRISFGKETTFEQIQQAVLQMISAIADLREISPVWSDLCEV